MFSKMRISTFTGDYSENLNKLRAELDSADAVLIGAGAGLSTSAGFDYSGERFKKYFSDFEEKYDFHSMYNGGFYPYETFEEFWAFWSRYVFINRYQNPPKDTYEKLFELVKGKNYFVLTTNVDHCFQKAGFDKQKMFYTQGDYGLFQCSEPCHNRTYDNEEQIVAMLNSQKNMKIPTELIPTCPVCGKPMTMNLRSDNLFVEDEGWHRAQKRYEDFLESNADRHILYLELGVGGNTPAIIKYPFWQFTAQNKRAVYACINYGEVYCPNEISTQSILLDGDIDDALQKLKAV